MDKDRVIVTANVDDFAELCGGAEVHPGLITMASGTRDQQLAMILAAIAHIDRIVAETQQSPEAFMVNRVVEVDFDGECMDYPLPT